MSQYLDPVVARLSMDLGDFASGIARAKALMKSLNTDLNINTSGLDTAAAKVATLKTALSGLNTTVKVNTDGLGSMAAKTAAVAAGTTAATAIMINGWRLTGTALHWLIAGGAELAAVTLPALVALGAAVAVMAPAAQNAADHMKAVYTATQASGQMFGVTAGQAVGLTHSLQAVQQAAAPSVFGALGSAIITVNERFGTLGQTGLQVARIFQTFMAKVSLDFGPGGALGGTMDKLLGNMTRDLTGLGQIFGNVLHTVANFASSMPGLAEVLLKVLTGVTSFASHLSGIAGPVLTAAMAFEEFNRWGGLVAATLTRVGLAGASLEGGIFSFTRMASVIKGLASVLPMVVSQVGALVARFSESGGEAMAGFATSLENSINGLSTFGAVAGGAAAVGLGVLIYKLATAKSSVLQLAQSLQQSVEQASNLNAFQVIISNVQQLNAQLPQVTENFRAIARQNFGAAVSTLGELSGAVKQQIGDLANIAQGAQAVSKAYGTGFAGALQLADMANVKLADWGKNSALIMAQINGVVAGFKAMGAPLTAVGSDINALGIQSALASSQVSQLNSAWDQFIGNLTGGTSGLAALNLDLGNLTTGVNNVTNVLGKAKSISLSIKTFASDLTSFAGNGAQAWQNFNKVISGSGQQLIDWLRTAGAEGAVSGAQFKQGVLDMASALVPLAADSKTAQAEVLGLVAQIDPSINTWAKLGAAIRQSGASIGGLGSIVSQGTQAMANMQAVASKLGNVLNSALTSALQSAQVQASGAAGAMEKYSAALMSGNKAAAAADYKGLISDLEKLGLSAQQAAALIASVTQNLNGIPSSKTSTVYVNTVYTQSGAAANPSVYTRLPGHAAGTPSAPAGWAWVGEAGPELVRFRGGETVLPNQVSRGFADGAGGFVNHVTVHLDGKQIYSAVQKQSLGTQRRTGHNGMQRRTR